MKIFLRDLKNIPALTILTIFFCLGIIIARFLEPPFYVVYSFLIISLVSAIISIAEEKKFIFSILFFSLFFGMLLFKYSLVLPKDHINNLKPNLLGETLIEGTIIDEPIVRRSTRFLFQIEKIKLEDNWRKVSGKVLVNLFKKERVSYAQRLILEGRFFKPYNFSKQASPGFNYPEYLKQRGVYFVFNVKQSHNIQDLGSATGNPVIKIALTLKHKVKDLIYKHMPLIPADFLSAILLGERQEIEPELKNVFVQTGTAHILAISGLHVGIVAFILLLFFKALRMPRNWRFALVIGLLIGYCFLTGCRPSVIRATLMAGVLLFGYLIDRQANIYNSLSFAALIILLINPWTLFDVGFQLSFISVLAIVLLSPKIQNLAFKIYLPKYKIIIFFLRAFCVSLAAWLGTAALIAYYFRIFSPVTVLANLVVVPFMSVVVALGLTFIFVAAILPILAYPFAISASVSIILLIKICTVLAGMPFAYFYLNP